MEFIDFKGHQIRPDKIVAISKVKVISTGGLHCDWEYGFVILLVGNKIKIPIPTETDSMGNHKLSRGERKILARHEREKLIDLLKDI